MITYGLLSNNIKQMNRKRMEGRNSFSFSLRSQEFKHNFSLKKKIKQLLWLNLQFKAWRQGSYSYNHVCKQILMVIIEKIGYTIVNAVAIKFGMHWIHLCLGVFLKKS